MEPRMNYYQHLPEGFAKLTELAGIAKKSFANNTLYHLVQIRASQINECAFCVDMHMKEAKIDGEKELRLHHVSVWKDSPLFSAKEKAALRWTEALTKLSHDNTSDALFSEMREHFSDKEIVNLNMVIAVINTWNRFAVSFRSVPGSMDKLFGLEKAGL